MSEHRVECSVCKGSFRPVPSQINLICRECFGEDKLISEFLNDLEYARNELLNHYNYEPNTILIELRKKWEAKT